jgi:hypothetical protein
MGTVCVALGVLVGVLVLIGVFAAITVWVGVLVLIGVSAAITVWVGVLVGLAVWVGVLVGVACSALAAASSLMRDLVTPLRESVICTPVA